jgi:hypothetical protein
VIETSADDTGLSVWARGKLLTQLPWCDIDALMYENAPDGSRAYTAFVMGIGRFIRWTSRPSDAGTSSPQAPDTIVVGGDELAAIVSERARIPLAPDIDRPA